MGKPRTIILCGSVVLNQESVDRDECDEGVNADMKAQFADSLPLYPYWAHYLLIDASILQFSMPFL
jgi:hypothetical protein